ncbi:MAG: hypothetical protein EPN20_08685 [Magnetospirillum sp.]|nr:MAG: hypothetical protein EPN20_08685 [Magnetospirillum sp.]
MRRLITASLVVGLSLGLTGCALPDLVAHTVKAVEKSQRNGGAQPASSQPASSQPAPAAEPEEAPPPPQSAPQPRRSSVTVEELPGR